MTELAELLHSWDDDLQAARELGVGPSDAGRCRRQVAYAVRGTPPDTARPKDAAIMGTLIHEGIARVIAERFVSTLRESNVPVTIPGLHRQGTADDVWWWAQLLTDYKTTSERMTQYWVNRGGPDEDVWDQPYAYAYGLNAVQPDTISAVRVVIIDRNSGDSHEWVRPYTDEDGQRAVAALVALAAAIDSGQDLPRDGAGPGRGYPCDYCPFVKTCWQLDDVPEGMSAQSALIAGDAELVAAAAADYLEAQQTEAKAKRAKEDARAFLVGINVDDLDGYRVRWGGGRLKTETELDVDALCAIAAKHDEQIPMREVEKRSPLRISVGRVKHDEP